MNAATVRFGVSGWDYKDWQGPLYPRPMPAGFRALPWLARFVDFMEVNVSFYRILDPAVSRRWVDETPHSFGFVLKAWRGWTHDGLAPEGPDLTRFHAFMAPIADENRLEGILAQFPPSFRDEPDSRRRLIALRAAFAPTPVYVEVRHRSLYHEEFFRFLEAEELSFVNVDLPPVGTLPRITRVNTGPRTFLRLHGRNRRAWSDPRSGRDDRYDHAYTDPELDEVMDTVRALSSRARHVLVGANNHFQAHAPAALVGLRSRFEGRTAPAPARLIESHPQLRNRAHSLDEAADESPPREEVQGAPERP